MYLMITSEKNMIEEDLEVVDIKKALILLIIGITGVATGGFFGN